MRKVQHEQMLQIECVAEFNKKYPTQEGRLYMNYNNPPNERTGAILKSAGLLKGVADLSYLLQGGRTVFIEFKHGANKQTQTQKEFELRVTALGFPYYVARTLEEFMQII
jgi:hypothetical protein